MNLIAKLPRVASYIYRRSFHNGDHIEPKPTFGLGSQLRPHARCLQKERFQNADAPLYDHPCRPRRRQRIGTHHAPHQRFYPELIRTLSFAGCMGSLAGPLHGLANQEVIKWIFEMVEKIGTTKPTDEQVAQYVKDTLAAGKVIPGYGHAVLRQPDPRFTAQKGFAERNVKNDDIVKHRMAGVPGSASDPQRAGQGEKPLAERRCPLRRIARPLWLERVQLLYSAVRCLTGDGCVGFYLLVTGAGHAIGAAQVGEPEMGERVFEGKCIGQFISSAVFWPDY